MLPARILCLLLAGVTTAHAGECKVVNLMPDYWRALAADTSGAALRAIVVDAHPNVYNAHYVALPEGGKWDEMLARERSYATQHRTQITAVETYLVGEVPRFMAAFERAFADFRCDFTFYVGPSFGNLDGSAATVDGAHVILFAPDVIPRLHKTDQLKVLIDHETFHIYHHQATGVYGASADDPPTILNGLWTEGLATFVSWRMNEALGLEIAMLQPGIPEATRPLLPVIAKDLLAHLDDRDMTTYGRYFIGNRQPAGYPGRSGYYVGVLIADALSKRYSLRELAHLNGPALRDEVTRELEKMQSGK